MAASAPGIGLAEDRPWARLVVAAASGATLHLAYPRPGWDWLGWVALAPLFALSVTAPTGRRAFVEGWLAGLAFFVPLLRWLTHTMTTFSSLPAPLAVLVLVALSAYLALYWGATQALAARLARRHGPRALWLIPALWVAAELARTHALSGFPWGLLGYVPYRRLGVIALAAWTGVYGVSALLLLTNAAVAFVLVHRRRRAALVTSGLVGLGVGSGLLLVAARPPADPGPELPVAVTQGNIEQAIKWDHAFKRQTLETYAALTREAAKGSRLVVWPEAAVPAYLRFDSEVLDWVTTLAAEVGTPLVVGAPDARPGGSRPALTNSAFLLTPRGIEGRYDKMQLVPFGEYVPLKRLLFFVEAVAAEIGDFTPGEKRSIFPLGEASFGTVICYEVVFPDLFRRFVAEGADFMVNITNDAWFGDSGGPLQHLAMVPLRAVENGTAVVRAANTGVSAFVASSGRIGPQLALGQRGVLRAGVALRRGQTFYTRFGDLFAYAMTAVSAAALATVVLGRVSR